MSKSKAHAFGVGFGINPYLETSGLTVLRPELRPRRYAYTSYGQSHYAQALGGSFLDNQGEEMTGSNAAPVMVDGKAWLLHRVRLKAGEARQYLFETQEELLNRGSECYAVWGAQLWPDEWAQWIDGQTNWPPPPDPNAWRRDTPLIVVPAETLMEVILP